MGIVQSLVELLTGWLRPRQNVRDHWKHQAYGCRWSRHRPRHIDSYGRSRPRRTWS